MILAWRAPMSAQSSAPRPEPSPPAGEGADGAAAGEGGDGAVAGEGVSLASDDEFFPASGEGWDGASWRRPWRKSCGRWRRPMRVLHATRSGARSGWGSAPAACGEFMAAWLRGEGPESPVAGMSPLLLLRFAADDLKAFALEATLAGGGRPSSKQLGDWLWGRTALAVALDTIRRRLSAGDDERGKVVAPFFGAGAAHQSRLSCDVSGTCTVRGSAYPLRQEYRRRSDVA